MGAFPTGTAARLAPTPLRALPKPSGARTPLGPIRVARRSRKALREAGETPEQAYEDLHHAILLAKERGQQVPCLGSGADDWVSDEYEQQRAAADQCLDCPMSVFAQCQRYADVSAPKGGTWAGVTSDRAKKPKKVDAANLCRKGLHDLTAPGATIRGTRRCLECRRVARRGRMRAPGRPVLSRDCTCGCGGVTRGGWYLPGHDSLHLVRLRADVRSKTITADAALAEIAHSEVLQAKLRARIAQ